MLFSRLFVRRIRCVHCSNSGWNRAVNLMWSIPGILLWKSTSQADNAIHQSVKNRIDDLLANGKYSEVVGFLSENRTNLDIADEFYNSLVSYAYFMLAITGEDEASLDLLSSENAQQSFAYKAQRSFEYAQKAHDSNPASALSNKLMGLSLSAVHKTSNFLTRRYNLKSIISFLEKSVEVDDNDWETHHYLASHYLETIKSQGPLMYLCDKYILGVPYCPYDKALKHLMRAEQLKPSGSCANLTKLALLFYKQKDYQNAKLYIEKAVNYECKNRRDIREKREAVTVLDGWMSYTQFFKTVKIN